MSDELWAQVQDAAKREGVSAGQIVRRAVQRYVTPGVLLEEVANYSEEDVAAVESAYPALGEPIKSAKPKGLGAVVVPALNGVSPAPDPVQRYKCPRDCKSDFRPTSPKYRCPTCRAETVPA